MSAPARDLSTEKAAELLDLLFGDRSSMRAKLVDKRTARGRISRADLAKHVAGTVRLGGIPFRDNSRVGWACIDLDFDSWLVEPDDPEAIEILDAIFDALSEVGAEVVVERSRRKGWHVWIFFDKPVPARDVRAWLLAVARNAGVYELMSWAREHLSETIEDPRELKRALGKIGDADLVCPRSDQIADIGNGTYLPLCGKDASPHTRFHERGDAGSWAEANQLAVLRRLIEHPTPAGLVARAAAEATRRAGESRGPTLAAPGDVPDDHACAWIVDDLAGRGITLRSLIATGRAPHYEKLNFCCPFHEATSVRPRGGSAVFFDRGNGQCSACDEHWATLAEFVEKLARSAAEGREIEEVDWPPLRPLPALADVPRLDTRLLPKTFRRVVEDAARLASVAPDGPALAGLVVLGAAVGNRILVQPQPHNPRWRVAPNLYGGLVGQPGTKKSDTVRPMFEPLRALEGLELGQFQSRRAEHQARLELLRDQVRELGKQIKQGGTDDDAKRYVELRREIETQEEKAPREPRRITSDATPEALLDLAAANPHGILIRRDELSGLFNDLRDRNKEALRGVLLEGWTGYESYTADRVEKSRNRRVETLCLSLFGSIQPGPLMAFALAWIGRGQSDGLMERFLWVWPDLPDFERTDLPPDEKARERYEKLVLDLAQLRPDQLGLSLENPVVMLAPEAQARFDAWHAEVENRVRSAPAVERASFTGWLGKQPTTVLAIALLLELMARREKRKREWLATGEAKASISERALGRAIALVEFFEGHEARVLDVELNPGDEAARQLAEHIVKGDVKDGDTIYEVSRRDWRGLKDESLRAALRVLAERGWLCVERVASGRGRPREEIRLRPGLAAELSRLSPEGSVCV